MILGLTACGGKEEPESTTTPKTTVDEKKENTTESISTTAAATTAVTTTKPTTQPSKKVYTNAEILAFAKEKAGIWVYMSTAEKTGDGDCRFDFCQIGENSFGIGVYPGGGRGGEITKIVEENGKFTVTVFYKFSDETGESVTKEYVDNNLTFGNGTLTLNGSQTCVYAGKTLEEAINYVLSH